MFADTHCHLDFESFSVGIERLKCEMSKNFLEMVVVPSISASNWDKVISLCGQDERFFFALGLHPYCIEEHKFSDVMALENKLSVLMEAKTGGLVALGEVGLDATRPDIEKQVELFEMQLCLAEKYKLPVIVHVRKLHNQVIELLKRYALVGGVIHAFSGSYELMLRYINLGFKIGVGPVITWASSGKTRSAIMKAPLEYIVLETDAPDMYVAGIDKSQASPIDVIKVFEVLNEIRPESDSELRESLWVNSIQLFSRCVC